jgi:hypothetical protein
MIKFLTDNEVVAAIAQQKSLCHNQGHWSSRQSLAEIAGIALEMQHSVINIRRETNKVTDKLSKQARQATILSPCL